MGLPLGIGITLPRGMLGWHKTSHGWPYDQKEMDVIGSKGQGTYSMRLVLYLKEFTLEDPRINFST